MCLSATLPNIDCVSKWLDASLYRTEFRPVELRHRVCKARQVFAPKEAVSEGQDSHNREGPGELERVSLCPNIDMPHDIIHRFVSYEDWGCET